MPQVLQRNALLDISACPKAAMTTSVELQTLTKQSREWCVGVGVVVVWYHLSGLARCLSRQSVVVLCAQTTIFSLSSPRMPLRVSVHPTTKKERRRNYFGRIR